jgi:c-di-GMP-binding flagellar brake protein YcgR
MANNVSISEDALQHEQRVKYQHTVHKSHESRCTEFRSMDGLFREHLQNFCGKQWANSREDLLKKVN